MNNQLLIALARPDVSYVCGFRAWQQLGYQVRKGEKAIWILAPITVKPRTGSDDGDEEQRRLFFRAVPVFDSAQVDVIDGADPTPLEPPSQPLTGASHRHLLEPLQSFAATLGYSVLFQPIPGSAGGWCDSQAKQIVVDDSQPANAQARILVPWRRWCIRTFGMPGVAVVWWRSLPLSVFRALKVGLATVVAEPRA